MACWKINRVCCSLQLQIAWNSGGSFAVCFSSANSVFNIPLRVVLSQYTINVITNWLVTNYRLRPGTSYRLYGNTQDQAPGGDTVPYAGTSVGPLELAKAAPACEVNVLSEHIFMQWGVNVKLHKSLGPCFIELLFFNQVNVDLWKCCNCVKVCGNVVISVYYKDQGQITLSNWLGNPIILCFESVYKFSIHFSQKLPIVFIWR